LIVLGLHSFFLLSFSKNVFQYNRIKYGEEAGSGGEEKKETLPVSYTGNGSKDSLAYILV
jgi:hypothetical protein